MKTLKFLLTLISVTALTVACGSQQDPDRKYQDLVDNSTNNHTKVQVEGSYVDNNILKIVPDSDINFVEGEEGRFRIVAQVLIPGVPFSLRAINFPCPPHQCFKKIDDNTWEIRWTPTKNVVTGEAALEKYDVAVKMEFGEISSRISADTIQRINGVDRTAEFAIRVTAANAQPELSLSDFPQTIKEGDSVEFYVDVHDPDYNSAYPTQLDLIVKTALSNIENASQLIVRGPIVEKPNNVRRHHFTLVTGGEKTGIVTPFVTAAQDKLPFQFIFKADNMSNGTTSPELPVEFDLDFEVNEPDIEFLNKDSYEGGRTHNLDFVIVSSDLRGPVELVLRDTETSLKTLPGKIKSLDCTPPRSTQRCHAVWEAPCEASTTDIGVTARSYIGRPDNPVKTRVVTKEFKIKVNKAQACEGA